MKKRIVQLIVPLALVLLLGCTIPSAIYVNTQPDAVRTEIAGTVIAQMTSESEGSPTQAAILATASPNGESSETPSPTETNLPTETANPTNTTAPSETPTQVPTNTAIPPTPIPCNAVSFVKDVSFPDGSLVLINAPFTKTWRLKNVGTCTWNSAYSVVFMSGQQMGGPNSFPLTAGTVAPGQMIDVSVNLQAPNTIGAKQGNWALRSPEGVIFQLSTGPFWIKIQVVKIAMPTMLPLLPIEIVAANEASYSGAVKSNGTTLPFANIGDDSSNISFQGFIAFDISDIPDGATIKSVKLDLKDHDILGTPFNLGCMRLYKQNYGTVDSSDYFPGLASGAVARFCNKDELKVIDLQPEMIDAVQSQVGNDRVRFRVQFNDMTTNSNGIADMVRLGGDIRLIITYIP